MVWPAIVTYSWEIFSVQNIVEKNFTGRHPGPDGVGLPGSGGLQGLQLAPQSRHVVAPELGLRSGPVQRGKVGE